MTQSTAIVRSDDGVEQPRALAARNPADLALSFVRPLDELKQQLAQLEQFKRDIMIEGVDYGTIPGTPKPTLLKPGAEKLSLAFALAPAFEHANRIEDWERGFFHYEERCTLTSRRTGDPVASANGSANSKEPRYRWRKAERICPLCGKAAIIKGKEEYGGGWLCFRRKDGCGAKFEVGDPEIETQQAGNVENPEPWELANTILKMAQKRALVAAILIGTGGSGIWTQDIEDMPSVAGDAVIIDQGPTVPASSPRPAAAKAEVVSNADDPIWKRWLALLAKAQGLGLNPEPIRLPIGRSLLVSRGTALNAHIEQRLQELAAQEAEAHGADDQEDRSEAPQERQAGTEATAPASVPGPVSDDLRVVLARNAELVGTARDMGCRGLGSLTANESWPLENIEKANAELEARIKSRNSEIDQKSAREAGQAGF